MKCIIVLLFEILNISILKEMIIIINLILWFDIIEYFGISSGGFCDSVHRKNLHDIKVHSSIKYSI